MAQLAQAVKAKYPQYANVPDAQLEKLVVAKYPQYSRIATQKSVGGFAGNVIKSGARAVGDIASSAINVLNPDLEKNTVANIARIPWDFGKYLGGDTSEDNRAIQIGNFYKDRYGGMKNIGESLYNDPVGVALDASVVLGGAGAALKGVGSASKISGLTKAGNALSSASRYTDPLAMTGSGLRKITNKGIQKAGTRFAEAGEQIATRGIGNPAAQAKLTAKSGKTMADFIDEYNLYDRSPETAGQAKRAILKQYDDLATKSGSQVQVGQIVKMIDDEIASLQQGVGGVVADSDLAKIGELQRRKEQLLQAIGATDTQVPMNVGTDVLTDFRRRVIDPDVPRSMFNLDAQGSGTAKGAKKMRDFLRKSINSTDPRLEQLGLDYGMAKGVEDIFEKSQSRANNRQLINFTKLGSAGVGSIVAGAPGVVGGFAFEQLVNSPRFIKQASKSMRKAGNALKDGELPSIPQGGNIYRGLKAETRLSPDQTLSRSPSTEIGLQLEQEVAPYSQYSTKDTQKVNKEIERSPEYAKYPKNTGKYFKVKNPGKTKMPNFFRAPKTVTKGSFN